MIVRVDDLQPEGLRVDLALEVGPLSYQDGLEAAVSGTKLTALIRPSRGGVTCTGGVVAAISMPCSRCLASCTLQVDRQFDVCYLPAPPAGEVGGLDFQIPREDLDVSYLDAEGKLDMRDLVSEQIYLAFPMKPLCAPECRGLCPGCGSNLNAEICRCRTSAR